MTPGIDPKLTCWRSLGGKFTGWDREAVEKKKGGPKFQVAQ